MGTQIIKSEVRKAQSTFEDGKGWWDFSLDKAHATHSNRENNHNMNQWHGYHGMTDCFSFERYFSYFYYKKASSLFLPFMPRTKAILYADKREMGRVRLL